MGRDRQWRAEYMRQYNRVNKIRVNTRRATRRKERIEAGDETIRLRHRVSDRSYRERIRGSAKTVLRGIKQRAKDTGLQFDLTEEWYEAAFIEGCAVTGIPLSRNDKRTNRGPWTAHVDRIDSSKGYVIENCRLVCACFNFAKMTWSDHDVIRMAEALLSRRRGT